jgi:predicted DNA binding CopG/RHH family protein
MDKDLSYSERMKERQRIILEIDSVKNMIKDCDKKAEIIECEIRSYKQKIKDLEKELFETNKKKSELENEIKEFNSDYIKIGIPVPENSGYEMLNGLPSMKRDINIKLIKFLNDNKIREVFILI